MLSEQRQLSSVSGNPPAGKPLAGYRVLDLSRVLAGPMCAMALADLGADVIKIEHPERGDDTRDWGVRVGTCNTSYFNSANRNKRSVALDLQSDAGRQIARELALQSDIVIENFKLGGADKLGLGYAALSAAQPQLVYCSISGYSRQTPEAQRPGYDLVVQGESGLMALNGDAGQGPLKFGVAAVDLFTGMYAAQAVLAALLQRQHSHKGQHITMALYDCGLMISSYYGMEALLKQRDPLKFGNAHPSIVPYGVFEAADGPLVITVGNHSQFVRFCQQVIHCPEWASDPRFASNSARTEHRAVLLPMIESQLRQIPRAQLLQRLQQAQIPCGEVLGMTQALSAARTQDAALLHHYEDSEAGPLQVLAPPYVINGQRMSVERPPPHLGEHTDQVLGERLQLPPQHLAALRQQGVIR